MSRYLNVSIMQMPVNPNVAENLLQIRRSVDALMHNYTKPELVVGVENGISGFYADTIPGKITEYLSQIAKEYEIYFIPGTMMEKAPELPEGSCYNTCPVFDPKGNLIKAYRKKAPFYPGEPSCPSQDKDYFVFDIPEKNTKIGLMICYEQYFPEVSRTLALMGAEVLVCPAAEMVEYLRVPDVISRARALENEAFFIFTTGTGTLPSGVSLQGRSTIVNPEGDIIWQANSAPCLCTKTLDLECVTYKRNYGPDQHLKCLKEFDLQNPFAHHLDTAPIYQTLTPLPRNSAEFFEQITAKAPVIGKQAGPERFEAHLQMNKIIDDVDELLGQ